MELTIVEKENVEIIIVGTFDNDGSLGKANQTIRAEKGKTYSLSILTKAFVFVLPELNAESTNYQIDYQLVFAESENLVDNLKMIYFRILGGEDGTNLFFVTAGCVACYIILICCCFCVCIRTCWRKCQGETKDDDSVDQTKVFAEEIDFN